MFFTPIRQIHFRDFQHHQIREWHVMTYIKVDAREFYIIYTLNNARDIVFLLVYCGINVRASQIFGFMRRPCSIVGITSLVEYIVG